MTFSFYQSLTTIPVEMREASAIFRLNPWLRFKTMELPFGAVGLIWNSMMSWAGGWFFLMAAETFTVGSRDFRLPGLGSYLQSAANAGDFRSILLGVGTLVLVIVLMDQFVWRQRPGLGRQVQSGNGRRRGRARVVVLRCAQPLVAGGAVHAARLASAGRADRRGAGAGFQRRRAARSSHPTRRLLWPLWSSASSWRQA